MIKIPQFGDPELLPKGTVVRPAVVDDAILLAPDIEKLPWKRSRGDEWTTKDFRTIVFGFLADFFRTRSWAIEWEVIEKASAERSGRLPDQQFYLVFRVTDDRDRTYETSVVFPPEAREDNPDRAQAILRSAAQALDAGRAASL